MLATSDTEVDYAVPDAGKWSENEDTAVDFVEGPAKGFKGAKHADEDYNFVRRTLAKEKPLPPVTLANVYVPASTSRAACGLTTLLLYSVTRTSIGSHSTS